MAFQLQVLKESLRVILHVPPLSLLSLPGVVTVPEPFQVGPAVSSHNGSHAEEPTNVFIS